MIQNVIRLRTLTTYAAGVESRSFDSDLTPPQGRETARILRAAAERVQADNLAYSLPDGTICASRYNLSETVELVAGDASIVAVQRAHDVLSNI